MTLTPKDCCAVVESVPVAVTVIFALPVKPAGSEICSTASWVLVVTIEAEVIVTGVLAILTPPLFVVGTLRMSL